MARNKHISLLDDSEAIWKIKKHSSIVQMGNITTMQERKAINALIRIAKDILKRDPDARIFRCDLGILKAMCGLQDTNNVELKKSLKSLADTQIEYNIMEKEGRERGVFSFLAAAKINEKGRGKASTVSFEFPELVLDVIKHPNMFVRLNLLVIRGLDSKHSIALYEFLKDYLGIEKYRCHISDFRKMMGIQDHQYKSFTMIRKRILDVAISEINLKTDIEVGYSLEKKGRQIVGLNFHMVSKKGHVLNGGQDGEIRKKLQFFGINKDKADVLLKKHEEQYLRANIAIVEEQIKKGKVKNPTGYLLKAFDSGFSEQITEHDKNMEAEKLEKKKLAAEREALAEQEEAIKTAYQKRTFEQVEQCIEKMEPAVYENHKQEFLENLLKNKNSLFARMYESKGFDYGVIQNERYKFLADELLALNGDDFDKFKAQYSLMHKSITS